MSSKLSEITDGANGIGNISSFDEFSGIRNSITDSTIKIPDFDTLIEMLNGSYDSFSNCDAPLGEELTDTIEKKMETEVDILTIYEDILNEGSNSFPKLNKKAHISFTHGVIGYPLPAMFSKLDASKTWIAYWLMNSCILLETELSKNERENASKLLLKILNTNINDNNDKYQGFGGGEYQIFHLAASYAAILTLALTKDQNVWSQIDPIKVKNSLLELKLPNGSFIMHKGGESDTRAVYCALCIAQIFDILDDDITKGVFDWLIECQTYEGGFSGEPGDEAHGGYTFCALAAMFILTSPDKILKSNLNIDSLIKWTVDRQYNLEGGFSGRTNKLVDGCYSHWIGGSCALIETLINYNSKSKTFIPICDRQKLQNYILCCCQDKFGLRDKPGCSADFYHTNYVLCGLSMCQHYQVYDDKLSVEFAPAFGSIPQKISDSDIIDIKSGNIVSAIDSVFGLPYGYAKDMYSYYHKAYSM